MRRTCLICGTEYLTHAGVQACLAEHERAAALEPAPAKPPQPKIKTGDWNY